MFKSVSIFQKDEIIWHESRKLQWSDFHGTPDDNVSFVAMSNTGINFRYQFAKRANRFILDYTVYCVFDKKESWYKPDRATAHVLGHEQTHFNITELHARKLRKALTNFSVDKPVKTKIDTHYLRFERDHQAMQHRFDKETQHSRNHQKEMYWRNFIEKELQKYDAYS